MQNPAVKVWRALYPIGIHFAVSQVVAYIALLVISKWNGGGMQVYYNHMIMLTGVIGLITIPFALYFYRRDRVFRLQGGLVPETGGTALRWKEGILLLLMGAAFALFLNWVLGLLQIFIDSSAYQDTMAAATDGKNIGELILWMGIIAPLAEELIFRWLIYLRLRDYMKMVSAAVISGALFGIYHGNFLQAVYAGILGAVFAYFLEMSGNLWSSVLLHIGANTGALLISEYGIFFIASQGYGMLLFIYAVLLVIMVIGTRYFNKKGHTRGLRMV